MQQKLAGVLGVAGILVSFGTLSAGSAGDEVPFPNGLRDWFFVNSLSATADSPLFGHVGGVHHIYVNAKGLRTLKAGGPFPYPDGTVFADDVHDFTVKDDAYLEGVKKFVTVMVKDSKKYATTGGWGFQVWAGGDPTKPQLPISPTRSRLALRATRRKKPRTTHFPLTFREISAEGFHK
jgi:hypothetical protein